MSVPVVYRIQQSLRDFIYDFQPASGISTVFTKGKSSASSKHILAGTTPGLLAWHLGKAALIGCGGLREDLPSATSDPQGTDTVTP